MLIFIDDGYGLKAYSWCSKHTRVYPTLAEAKRQCRDDPSCSMFYDASGAGTHFVLCEDGAEIKISRKSSVLYFKISEYVCICTPLWNSSNYKDMKTL